MVTPVVVMSTNLFLFLTSDHPIYSNILPKHTFKAKADIENWFYIAPYFFFSAFPPTDCPYLPLLHVFTTAWDPCFWHVRASWLLNKHDHVEQSLVLPELLQFVNVKGMKNSEWYKNGKTCSSWFSDTK